jgi:hypothetical protein
MVMKNEDVKTAKVSQQGIALVIVLGFLAIMTIMAVSFAINMRTERLTSRMYLDSVRSRHFIDVALARALSDIDYEMNTPAPVPSPLFDFYASNGSGPLTNLFSGDVTNYLASGWTGVIPQSRFVNISNVVNSSGPPIGRYAYLAVNLTGLLDMNYVGLNSARASGRSPGEIRINPNILSDVTDVAAWNLYKGNLTNRWRRIETVNEFLALASGPIIKSGLGSRNFFPSSRSVVELNPNNLPKFDIGREKAALVADRVAGVQALVDSGVNAADADGVFNAILDFADTDNIPETPDGISGEAVPMINEIVFSGRLTKVEVTPVPNQTFRYSLVDFKASVELWYPFPVNSPTPQFTLNIPAPANPVFNFSPAGPAALLPLFNFFNPTSGVPPTLSPGNITINNRGYFVLEYQFPNKQTVTNVNAPGLIYNVEVLDMQVKLGNDIVDQVKKPFPLQLLIAANGAELKKGISCLDPRINHLASAPNWKEESGGLTTLNAMNNNTKQYTAGEPIGADPVMYCRDFPLAQPKAGVGAGSVADLGFISLGQPWRTLALYNKTGSYTLNPILDFFTVEPVDSIKYGLMNLNSRRREALASVFFSMPVNSAPEIEPNIITLTEANAFTFADAIQQITLTSPTNQLSGIGELPNIYTTTFDASLDSDARIESLIRNSINLFTVRQNLFGIVMETHTLSEDGTVTGVEKALAIVWRDPVKTPPTSLNGINETIVRYFAWLDE